MTMTENHTADPGDEMLMAYVDGELSAVDASAVERAAAADPRLADRIATYHRTRLAAQTAFAGLTAAPPPDRLTEALRPRGRQAGPAPLGWRGSALPTAALPLAATLALVAGLGGFLAGRMIVNDGGELTARAASPTVLSALAHQPGGTPLQLDGARLTATGTYAVTGGLCRAFTLEGQGAAVRGVACDFGAGWRPELVVSAPTTNAAQTASGAAEAALEGYLDAAGASAALEPAEEARRLAPPSEGK